MSALGCNHVGEFGRDLFEIGDIHMAYDIFSSAATVIECGSFPQYPAHE